MPARLKAFLVHLACSVVLAAIVLLVVFQVWYPAPLQGALGVTSIFLLLLLVDVVLGPLLTLLVYNNSKKTLLLDLAVIACLQMAAMVYGLWTMAEGRPAWIVFNVDRFDLVQVVDIDTRKLDEATAEYRQPSWLGPQWVAAIPPTDVESRNDFIFDAVFSGLDLPHRPNLYRPLLSQQEALQQKMQPLEELTKFNDERQVEAIRQQWPAADAWLPLMARVEPMVVLLQRSTTKVVAVVDLSPWADGE